mgnify:CR=1 FL=1
MSSVTQLVQQLIEIGQSKQINSIEAYASQVQELEVEVSDAQVENLQKAAETGVGVRVLHNARLGFAYTTDLSSEGLTKLVQEALENSSIVPTDQYYSLAQPQPYEELELLDRESWDTVSIEEKIALAKGIETAAKAYDRRVSKVRMARFSEQMYQVALANSYGLTASYAGTGYSASVLAIAQEGENTETGWGFNFSHRLAELNPEQVGVEAGQRSVAMLGARTVSSQKADIILDPAIGAEFLGVIAPALTGDAIQKGKSLFFDKLGQTVASSIVNISDDGRKLAGAAAAPVDDEGVPTGETPLIVNGVLQGFLHNIYTARKAGVAPTGNGLRSSFRGRPESSPSNFYLLPGNKPAAEIIAGVQRGLYVTSVMGMHTANPISGDFSLGASGLWVENGEFAYPVRGVAIAGNIVDFLKSMVEIGSDLKFLGSYGSPTIRVAGISISG